MSKKIIFGGIFTISIVMLLAAVWGARALYNTVMTPPQTFTVGEAFIGHMAAGEIDKAMELVSADLRSDEFASTLAGFIEENAPLFTASTQVEFTGRGFYNEFRYAHGTISSGDTSSFVYLEFVDENGETRVSYMSFDEEDIPEIGSEDESGN